MVILGLSGKAGAGKDSVADYLVRRYGFVKFSFSDALYREVAEAFGLEDESLLRDRATKEIQTKRLALCNCADKRFVDLMLAGKSDVVSAVALLEAALSPRQVLQWWGTEYRRAQDPDYWVKQAQDFVFGVRGLFRYPEMAPQHFVNTSVRFPNERGWIRSFGGNVWHIHRDGVDSVAEHQSEAGLPVLTDERQLWNNYTLEYLHKGVDQLLTSTAEFVRMEPPLPLGEVGHSIELDITSE